MKPPARGLGNLVVASLFAVSMWAVPLASPVLAQSTESFRDEFRSVGFAGNDGSSAFAGPWRERGESDGPNAGSIRVVTDDRCWGGAGNCLRVGSDGGELGPFAVDRAADLTGAESATLRFSWRRRSQGQVSGGVRILISGSGGSSWTTLVTIPLAGSQQASSETFDITPWAGSATTLRFQGEGSAVSGYLHLDNVDLEASIVSPSATTTTAPGTSTTTTTTSAGTSTTTTAASAGTSTTTTMIGAGTTTTPSGASTTTTNVVFGGTTPTPPGTSAPGAAGSADGPSPDDAGENDTADREGDPATTQGSGTTATPAGDDMPPQSAVARVGATSPPGSAEDGVSDEPLAVSGSVDSSSSGPPMIALVIAQILFLGSLIAVLSAIGPGRSKDGVGRS